MIRFSNIDFRSICVRAQSVFSAFSAIREWSDVTNRISFDASRLVERVRVFLTSTASMECGFLARKFKNSEKSVQNRPIPYF